MPENTIVASDAVQGMDVKELRTAFSLQNALLDAAVDGIIAINSKGIIQMFNRGAENLFGYKAEEVIGRNVSYLMPAPFAKEHDRYMANYHASGTRKIIGIGRDVEGKKRNGDVFPLHLSVGQAETPLGRMYIGICHDLTNYKNALLKLHSAEQRYREIVESQTELIMRLDSNMRLTFVNPAMCRYFHCDKGHSLLGTSLIEHVHEDDRIVLTRQLPNLTENPALETLRVRMRRPDGDTRWVEWRVRPASDKNKLDSWELQGFGVDITEKLQAKEQVAFLVSHDQLTGLLNRRGFKVALDERLNQGADKCSILSINLDRFDLINETQNYATGDTILKMAAERIRSSVANQDVCARLTADDFMVMLEGVSTAKDVHSIANRLQRRLAEPYRIEDREFHLTACIGISIYPDNGVTTEKLTRGAQAALREAKSRGRQELAFFSEALEQRQKSDAELELGIRQALDHGLFELVYQPKYRLIDNTLQGFEVLLRWFHPDWGPVSPARFVPFAEQYGLIDRIGRWVLESAAKQWSSWTRAGLTVPQMAINISTKQLEATDFKAHLLGTLEKHDVPAAAIELEITEGAALSQTDQQIALIADLRHEGFSIAIDDFGTGYSSLSQLSSLPATTLKIDRAFVNKIMPGATKEPVIEAVIALGHSLGMQIVAEGVETQAQREFLHQHGCDIAQGFLYSRPLPAAKMKELLFNQTTVNAVPPS